MRQKDYPKQIVVKDSIWAIRFVRIVHTEGVPFDPRDVGHCTKEDKEILIKMGLKPKDRLATVVHEILHAFEFEYGIHLGHEIIDKIEYPLAEFIMENIFMPLSVTKT